MSLTPVHPWPDGPWAITTPRGTTIFASQADLVLWVQRTWVDTPAVAAAMGGGPGHDTPARPPSPPEPPDQSHTFRPST